MPTSQAETAPAAEPVVIKKYANRRLYDTDASAYVTLDDLSDMVKRGGDFVVYAAKTNEDITRQVLTQIIMEEENRGENLLPVQFLRQLIRFYGGGAAGMLPSYLQLSLDAFTRQQEKLRETFGVSPHFFEQQARQNMELFEQAVRMFTPPYVRPDSHPAPHGEGKPNADELAEMRRRLEEMSRQIDRLSKA